MYKLFARSLHNATERYPDASAKLVEVVEQMHAMVQELAPAHAGRRPESPPIVSLPSP